MKRNVKILIDRVCSELGIATQRGRHNAFQWRLPPSETSGIDAGGYWDDLAARFRPKNRGWLFGMTSMSEQVYCDWYADKLYSGRGKIVELGAWLGALTMSIAMGLRRNPRTPREVIFHCYDRFRWYPSFEIAVKGTPFEGVYKRGDCFLPLFLSRIKDAADLVAPHKGSLHAQKWVDGPIEFLVVDAMKSEHILANVQKNFFPSLMTGRGILMHQDFMHFYEGWIHVAMYQLRDCYVPVYALPDAATVVFRCRKKPSLERLDFPRTVRKLPVNLIEDAYAWALEMVPAEHRDKIAAAHTMMYVHRNELETARRLLDRYHGNGPYGQSREFKMMLDYLRTDWAITLAPAPPTANELLKLIDKPPGVF